jgi:5,10-methylene-tetrahydrofolate dehydrogenase/methenyl tetrahydrofolate cyclohydrolase
VGCVQAVDGYNRDENVHGILVQLPMPGHINEQRVLDSIAAEKDVDGFSPANIGKLAMRGREPSFVACTPKVIACYHRVGLCNMWKLPQPA